MADPSKIRYYRRSETLGYLEGHDSYGVQTALRAIALASAEASDAYYYDSLAAAIDVARHAGVNVPEHEVMHDARVENYARVYDEDLPMATGNSERCPYPWPTHVLTKTPRGVFKYCLEFPPLPPEVQTNGKVKKRRTP